MPENNLKTMFTLKISHLLISTTLSMLLMAYACNRNPVTVFYKFLKLRFSANCLDTVLLDAWLQNFYTAKGQSHGFKKLLF